MSGTSRAPDLIEPFHGWKGLLADGEGGLWSPSVSTLWPVGEPLLATCDHGNHTPPAKGCGCGIYALKNFEDLRHRHYDRDYHLGLAEEGKVWVVAEIVLYGDVRPGAIGWRASKAAPQKVYVPAHKLPLGALIKKRYGVSLGVIDRFTGRWT